MMEWNVVCGSELAKGKNVEGKTGVTYINSGPTFEDFLSACKPLLFGQFRSVEGTRISDAAMVLVQVFCNIVFVSLLEPLGPVKYELDLRRVGSLRAGHGSEVIEGEVFWMRKW